MLRTQEENYLPNLLEQLMNALQERNNQEYFRNLVSRYIGLGADLNVRHNMINANNEYVSTTPLIEAARLAQRRKINLLIDNSAYVDFTNDAGDTAFMYAMWENDDVQTARLLLERGANINAVNNAGETSLLQLAPLVGNLMPEKINFLLNNGADIELTNSEGRNAIDLAANEEIRQLLLQGRAKHNVERVYHEIISFRGNDGAHEFQLQIDRLREALNNLRTVCENGNGLDGVLDSITIDSDNLFIHTIAQLFSSDQEFIDSATPKYWGIANLLLEFGSDINYRNEEGFTALMECADFSSNTVEIMRRLIRNGADSFILSQEGENLLEIAEATPESYGEGSLCQENVNFLRELTELDSREARLTYVGVEITQNQETQREQAAAEPDDEENTLEESARERANKRSKSSSSQENHR